MSKEVNKEQAKGATQEEITELTDDQLDEAAGGAAQRLTTEETRKDGAATKAGQQVAGEYTIVIDSDRPI